MRPWDVICRVQSVYGGYLSGLSDHEMLYVEHILFMQDVYQAYLTMSADI